MKKQIKTLSSANLPDQERLQGLCFWLFFKGVGKAKVSSHGLDLSVHDRRHGAAGLLGISLPWGRLRGGTGGAKMLPAWADRNGRASRVPLSRLQLLGAAGTAEGLKQI